MKKIDTNPKVLSVYLGNSGKQTPFPSYFLSQFRSLVHQNLSEFERRVWQEDIKRIDNYLHEFLNRSNVRSYVFFTSGKHFWKVLDFEFFLPPICKISNMPYLKPLEEALEKHNRYLILLVDREKARLLTVNLGEIEEHKDVFNGEVPQNVKAKKIDWGRDDKILRHIEDHLHRHLQIIAKATKEFAKGKNINFLIIGGHAQMLPKIKKHLPYPLNKMVRGEFITELNIPLSKILTLSKKVASGIPNC